jgi:hypothetical protein
MIMISYTWQSIFASSPANSGYYDETALPHLIWDWPKGTWFQERRDYLRERASRAACWQKTPVQSLVSGLS